MPQEMLGRCKMRVYPAYLEIASAPAKNIHQLYVVSSVIIQSVVAIITFGWVIRVPRLRSL